jgi:hypothetical protein
VNAATGTTQPTTKGIKHAFTAFVINNGSIKTVLNEELGKAVDDQFTGPSFVEFEED